MFRLGSFALVAAGAAMLMLAGCAQNPWLTPTPPPSPAPLVLPVVEAAVALPGLNPGAGGTDGVGNFVLSDPGARITVVAGGDGRLNLAIPMPLKKGATVSNFRDPVSGLALADNNLLAPLKDPSGSPAMNLLARLRPLAGTGKTAEGAVEKLELETEPLRADLSPWDSKIGQASFRLKAELKSVPEGAALRIALAASPGSAVTNAFSLAAGRLQNRVRQTAVVFEVTKTKLADGKDIGTVVVTMSVGRAWADGMGIPNIAIATLRDDGSAEILRAEFAGYTGEAEAAFTAVSLKGMSTFGLVALERALPTPAPGPRFYALTVVNEPPAYGEVLIQPASANGRYLQGTSVSLRAQARPGRRFERWDGDASGVGGQINVIMEADRTVVAVFAPLSFELATGSSPPEGGVVDISPYLSSYDYGTSVKLTAKPAPDFVFRGWSGDVTGAANPVTLAVNAPRSVTAVFARRRYSFTVAVDPVGWGVVTPSTGSGEANTSVSLAAAPVPGASFAFWRGDVAGTENPLLMTLDRDKKVVAIFTRAWYPLTTVAQPAGGGKVTPVEGSYHRGDVVTLAAVPHPDYVFSGWGGSISGAENPMNLVVMGETRVIANFAEKRFALSVNINPPGAGYIEPQPRRDYPNGALVLLTAVPMGYNVFVSWSGDVDSNNPSIMVEMNRHIYLTANFRFVPPR